MTDADRIRGLELAHTALDTALALKDRRDTYVPPARIADMTKMNAELDRILHESDEPPC